MYDRLKTIIKEMPKAENHLHIEGSTTPRTAIKIAKRNGIDIPFKSEEEIKEHIKNKVVDLSTFLECDRLFNSVCLHEEDFYDVVYDIGEDASKQNIIYQELHLDYPLNGARGVPLDVYMKGCEQGRKSVKRDFGVDMVFIAAVDRTRPPEECAEFVKSLEKYLDIIDGVGLDCDERGYPCRLHKEAFDIADKMGLYKTAHAGEDDTCQNIWEAIDVLKCNRIDHGVRAIDDEKLIKELADRKILLAMCTRSNVMTRAVDELKNHPIKRFMDEGIICSVSSDDPPYIGDLLYEYEGLVEELNFDEKDILTLARNAYEYSIRGQKYLPIFDNWVADFKKNNA